jgi:D-xylose transport system substrate-binding protein
MPPDNSMLNDSPDVSENEPNVPEKKGWHYAKAIVIGLVAVLAVMSLYYAYTLFRSPAPTSTEGDATVVAEELTNRGVVGISFDHLRSSRWRKERDMITQAIEETGGSVLVSVADSDPDLQLAQVKNLILQEVDVLLVVAVDADRGGEIVAEAHKAGIKVIAYDRLIMNSEPDYYISFDNVKVGELEAKAILEATGGKGRLAYLGGAPSDNNSLMLREGTFRVLQPMIDSGDLEVVLDQHIEKWNPQTAYEVMSEYLAGGGEVDAVITGNDNLAGGVIQALQENGLAGKVDVAAQDAVLAACRNIVAGLQTMTVYKPLPKLTAEAVEMSLAILDGRPVDADTTLNNGLVDVPAKLLDVMAVTKENMEDTVIKDGHLTYEEVFGTK